MSSPRTPLTDVDGSLASETPTMAMLQGLIREEKRARAQESQGENRRTSKRSRSSGARRSASASAVEPRLSSESDTLEFKSPPKRSRNLREQVLLRGKENGSTSSPFWSSNDSDTLEFVSPSAGANRPNLRKRKENFGVTTPNDVFALPFTSPESADQESHAESSLDCTLQMKTPSESTRQSMAILAKVRATAKGLPLQPMDLNTEAAPSQELHQDGMRASFIKELDGQEAQQNHSTNHDHELESNDSVTEHTLQMKTPSETTRHALAVIAKVRAIGTDDGAQLMDISPPENNLFQRNADPRHSVIREESSENISNECQSKSCDDHTLQMKTPSQAARRSLAIVAKVWARGKDGASEKSLAAIEDAQVSQSLSGETSWQVHAADSLDNNSTLQFVTPGPTVPRLTRAIPSNPIIGSEEHDFQGILPTLADQEEEPPLSVSSSSKRQNDMSATNLGEGSVISATETSLKFITPAVPKVNKLRSTLVSVANASDASFQSIRPSTPSKTPPIPPTKQLSEHGHSPLLSSDDEAMEDDVETSNAENEPPEAQANPLQEKDHLKKNVLPKSTTKTGKRRGKIEPDVEPNQIFTWRDVSNAFTRFKDERLPKSTLPLVIDFVQDMAEDLVKLAVKSSGHRKTVKLCDFKAAFEQFSFIPTENDRVFYNALAEVLDYDSRRQVVPAAKVGGNSVTSLPKNPWDPPKKR